MKKIVFECESITPILMHGADGKTAELRPASIKGVMRFWWRAINGNLSLDELKRQEGEIFGSTEKKSSFSVKIKDHGFSAKKISNKGHKFKIEFLLSNRCDFDVQSFFELVVLLGGFGKSAKKIDQGKIKILSIKRDDEDSISYSEPQSLNEILSLLNKINQSFVLQNSKIISQNFKFNYPMIHKIWIYDNTLNTKLKEDKIFKRSLNG